MTTALKPITTVYRGYKMRSRLEARWGIFFDTWGFPFEYEKEGFQLEHGWYLPDFWIPKLDVWVEIKPASWDPEVDTKTFPLCYDLAMSSKKVCLIIVGNPWPGEYEIYGMRGNDKDYGLLLEAIWAECRRCEGACLMGRVEHTPDYYWYTLGEHTCGDHGRHPIIGDYATELNAAYSAARQARFEHGEKG